MIQAVANAFNALMSVLKPIGDAFDSVFPPMTGERLVALTKGINDFTAGLKIGDTAVYNLKNTFQGVFAVLDIIKQALTAAGMAILGLINYLVPAGNGILSFTGSLGQFLMYIDDVAKRTNFFGNIFSNLANVLETAANAVGTAVSEIFKWLSSVGTISVEGITYFVDQVFARFEPFKTLGGILGSVLSTIGSILAKLAPIFAGLGDIIGNALDKVKDSIVNTINGGGNNSIFDALNTGLFAVIVLGIRKFINSLNSITEGAGGVLGGITEILDGVKGSLQAYQTQLKAGALLKIASAIGILALSLLVLSTIDAQKLSSALTAISVMFVELFTSMSVFEKLSGGGMLTMTKLSIGMIGLSTAILILSDAMTKLAKLDWDGIAKGLVGVKVLMVELADFMKVSNFSGMGVSTGLGIIALAAGINILADAVKSFGSLDTGTLIQGLIGVGAVLAEITTFVNLTENAKNVTSTAIGITILATSMLIFSQAISLMGNLSLETIGKGLLTMASSLAIIAAAVALLPSGSLILTGIGLNAIATSLIILSGALMIMGGMSWEAVGTGLVTLAGALTIIAVAMNAMQAALPGAAALLVISSVLAILAPVLIMLGSVSLVTIGTGLLALAGAFTVVGVAGLLLGPLTPVILGLSAAIALLGVGCLAVGAGLLMFSAGVTALAAAGAVGSAAIVLFITSIVNLIPSVATSLAKGVTSFAKTIGDGAPVIAESITKVINALLQQITTLIPSVVDAGLKLIESLLQSISANIGKIVDTGAQIVVAFINGLTNNLPTLLQAGFNFIISFIDGLATAIESNMDRLITAIQNLIVAMIDVGVSAITSSISKMSQAGVNLINGFIEGIKSKIKDAADWASNLASSVIESAKKVLGIHSPSRVFKDEVGAMIAIGMANGIKEHSKEASNASAEMSKDAFDTAKEWIDNRKYYNEISLEEEYYIWSELQTKYKNGTEERVKIDKEAYRVRQEMAKAEYDAAVKYINDKKYYNQLSLEDELAEWKKIQQQYVEGTEENQNADKEVYRIQQELSKKTYDDAVALIDDRKYYNKLSLKEELAIWQDVQSKYLEGTEERKKADREVYRVQQEINKENEDYIQKKTQIEDDANKKRMDLANEYYSKTKEINDKLIQDIASVNKEYEDAVNTRANTLYSSYGLFDKMDTKQYVSGDRLIQNLKNQNAAFESWQKNINELSNKGIDSDLMKELTDMGPKSASQIEALNSLSSDKLDQYVALWKTKHLDAKTQAMGELDSMRQETVTKIQTLTEEANTELNNYRNTWNQQMMAVNVDSTTQLTALQTEWSKKIGIITTNAESEIKNMSTSITASVTDMRSKTEQQITTLAQNIKNIIGQTDWYSVGTNIVDGMTQGIKDRTTALAQQAAATALAALSAAKAALGIHSPSTEFAEVGRYACEGFSIGLDKFSDIASSSASELGYSTMASLKNSISNISNIINDNIDNSPVIRPVLDLSNIGTGNQRISGLLSQGIGLNMSTTTQFAGSINTSKQNVLDELKGIVGNKGSTGGTEITQNVSIYSPTALSPSETARQNKIALQELALQFS
jgi:hypothetical protein